MAEPNINIEVVCAMPDRQCLRKLGVAPGTTAREAIALSSLQAEFPELDLTRCALGVFGRVVADDHYLQQGDRVEVYRPLRNEPRERRRVLAAQGGTMGGPRPETRGTGSGQES